MEKYDNFTTEELANVLEVQQQTILSLTNQISCLTKDKDKRPYNHNSDVIHISLGLSESAAIEIDKVLKYWMWSLRSHSKIFEAIENSPLPLREKLLLAYGLAARISQSRG